MIKNLQTSSGLTARDVALAVCERRGKLLEAVSLPSRMPQGSRERTIEEHQRRQQKLCGVAGVH